MLLNAMRRSMVRVVALAAVATVTAVTYGVHVHNRVVRSEEAVLAAWRQVRNVEQRRTDLIPQLVSVTEAYAIHERHVIAELSDARMRYLVTADSPAGAHQLAPLDAALHSTLILAERYPDLHTAELYRSLDFELRGTANRIVTERTRYNEAVSAHGALMRRLPFRLFTTITAPIAPSVYHASEPAS